MNALRLHKGAVPGRDKLKETRRLVQASRQRAARGSLLQGLRTFLTADSFMYGPLLNSPPQVHASDDSEPHTPEREQENGGLENVATRDEDGKDNDTTSDKNENGHDENERQSTRTILSVQRTARTARTVVAPGDGSRTPTSTVRVSTVMSETQVNRNGALLLGDQEEGTSSMTSSYGDEDHNPLDNEFACKVVEMLVSKVGGRYSAELGIDVDAGDEEVERWFLAVTLFHRHLTFDILKKTFQKLEGSGVVSVRGTLHMEENEVADILETAGYTTYKHRAAARLRKLASQLEAEHEGKVSTLKLIQDPNELSRQINNLHGLSTNTRSIFLRELRGVWPGAGTDHDRRTIRAAMHLRLGEFDKSEDASNKSSVSNQHTSLKRIAQVAGVDERDLEVALVKLGLSHERHYRECSGGLDCNYLISSDKSKTGE